MNISGNPRNCILAFLLVIVMLCHTGCGTDCNDGGPVDIDGLLSKQRQDENNEEELSLKPLIGLDSTVDQVDGLVFPWEALIGSASIVAAVHPTYTVNVILRNVSDSVVVGEIGPYGKPVLLPPGISFVVLEGDNWHAIDVSFTERTGWIGRIKLNPQEEVSLLAVFRLTRHILKDISKAGIRLSFYDVIRFDLYDGETGLVGEVVVPLSIAD